LNKCDLSEEWNIVFKIDVKKNGGAVKLRFGLEWTGWGGCLEFEVEKWS